MPADSRLPSWAVVSPERVAHIGRVAALVDRWAAAIGVSADERARWVRAAWLHDALRDAPESELARWAPDAVGPVELWHGPAAAARAEAEGERDRGILNAVRYHSIGAPDWDQVGRALYCADYLEPGRDFDRDARAALADRFPADPAGVFLEVVRARMLWLVRSGWPLPDLTVRLWNSVVPS